MSFDLLVTVATPVSKLDVNRAFEAIGAPLALHDEPGEASGYFSVFFHGTGFEALDGERAGGFEMYGGAAEEEGSTGTSYSLDAGGGGDDVTIAWIFTLAVATARGGTVYDPQSGRSYAGEKLDRLRSKVDRYRTKLRKSWESLSGKEKAVRTRQEGESRQAFKDRLFLQRASLADRKQLLRERMEQALSAGDEAETARVLTLLPAEAAYLEDGLDPCFRARRADVAGRYAARFAVDAVRGHLVASAGFEGVFAAPYVAFLLEALGSLVDAATLARARAAARGAEMREVLGSARG
jgi:hypothetical protein